MFGNVSRRFLSNAKHRVSVLQHPGFFNQNLLGAFPHSGCQVMFVDKASIIAKLGSNRMDSGLLVNRCLPRLNRCTYSGWILRIVLFDGKAFKRQCNIPEANTRGIFSGDGILFFVQESWECLLRFVSDVETLQEIRKFHK
jgi:hypothetical protein